MFARWKYNQSVCRVSKIITIDKFIQIAESAFNKLLELNHRHSQRRFATACYLLERSVGKIVKRDGLESISKFAMMNQLRFFRQKKLNSSIQFSDVSHSVSKSNIAGVDNAFTNVLGPGIITRANYHSAFAPSQIFSSNMEKASIMSGSAVPFQTQNPNHVSVQLNTTFTPSQLASNYDS